MTREHPQAELLRMAADNEDQLFECDKFGKGFYIEEVINHPYYNWRPVKQTKTITRWLWANNDGEITVVLLSEIEQKENARRYTIKLEWSETKFEVEE
jgi:hypothetical protein